MSHHIRPSPRIAMAVYRQVRTSAVPLQLVQLVRTRKHRVHLWSSVPATADILCADSNPLQIFADAVNDAEWTRFREYAPCVHELRLSDLRNVHTSVWTILTQLCAREVLLPRLERLVDFPVDSMSACYTMLLSPTIRDLGLAFDSGTRYLLVRVGVALVKPILSQLTSLSVKDPHHDFYVAANTALPLSQATPRILLITRTRPTHHNTTTMFPPMHSSPSAYKLLPRSRCTRSPRASSLTPPTTQTPLSAFPSSSRCSSTTSPKVLPWLFHSTSPLIAA